MRKLYFDCGMGAAGDMLTAALLELFEDRNAVIRQLNCLGIPGVRYLAVPAEKCGITGTHIRVMVDEDEEEAFFCHHDHGHDHCGDEHHHHDREGHHHTGMAEIRHIIAHLDIPDSVRQDIAAVYGTIADSESRVHGVAVDQIHFHEVGTMDAIADVTAVCWLLHQLGELEITASPVHVGSGQVRCAHGILPVPAPATALILTGVPIYGGEIRGELCTPTGAALLKHFVTRFGPMPVMAVEKIGYGMGKKDFPAANCVRALLGTQEDTGDEILELSCNLDDMTGEELGYAMDRLLEAGALDVFTTPIGMKKSRPGVMLTVLCKPEQEKAITEAMFRHTTTLGIRCAQRKRFVLSRSQEVIHTPEGDIRLKTAKGYGAERTKPEYEDLQAIASRLGISLREVKERYL